MEKGWTHRILGFFWLLDGVLQLQPQMFTMNMINGVMKSMEQGQPLWIEPSLRAIVTITTQNLLLVNWGIAVIQIGMGALLLCNIYTIPVLIFSLVWAFIIWYAGEGAGMLFTGQASLLTGAPGSVLLYGMLACTVLPRSLFIHHPDTQLENRALISIRVLRYIFGGLWIAGAFLQVFPYWWQQNQLALTVAGFYAPGTISALLVDPSLHALATVLMQHELLANSIISLLFLFIGTGILLSDRYSSMRNAVFVLSITISLLLWWDTEAAGMIFTGMSTDPNTGPLLIIIACICWQPHFEKIGVKIRAALSGRSIHIFQNHSHPVSNN